MDDHGVLDFDGSDHDERDQAGNGAKRDEGAGPACQPCRKKKAKCSREVPCSQCIKNGLNCLYDKEKGKPGMKAGAIDRIHRRLDALENMFLGQGVLWQQLWNQVHATGNGTLPTMTGNLHDHTKQLKERLDTLGRKRCSDDDGALRSPNVSKRMRTSSDTVPPAQGEFLGQDFLPPDLIDTLVELYFDNIHPWIPVLHVRQFRRSLHVHSERHKISSILHAITSVCVRFSDDSRLGDTESRSKLAESCRQAVILRSMESFSVEGLQALIICAFDTIGSGRGPSAWSIVGSMARTVEQLQLSTEDEDSNNQRKGSHALVKRMAFLPPCRDWREAEDRRRVFWTVFLMDRFCSIATGWNVCLTSADVKRRLPCEGALWEEGKPLDTPTPFFGVSDPPGDAANMLPSARPETADQASLGGFAYCIEATESLSLVTSFFLQQEVDVAKSHDVQMWLMRFKQLDLRLIQWKIFLPERWREACALNADGNMDPNLTLAHITHNTAVVLLHQGIAYPSQDWQSLPIRLPSGSSAETCMAASVEVSIIAAEFLRNMQCLTNPQFAFCLFICGRMLLAHAFYYDISLPNEFESLIHSLQVMAGRWNGDHSTTKSNLASKFAARLNHARQAGLQTLDIRQAAYSDNPAGLADEATNAASNTAAGIHNGAGSIGQPLGTFGEILPVAADQGETPDSITLAFPPLPLAFQAQPSSRNHTAMPSPSLDRMNHAAFTASKYSNLNGNMALPPGMSVDGHVPLEDLTSFLDYSFLPDQRVSAFSHSMD
ncbi:fungal-specific transcription factor domain-containing protein [Paraphoma chrysanthemicola]|uniref:Fungal-specific transcription factor domain-containing protein n=1 Tax=Paraphoma chrysanthemicola TaxID=798071 RepID=A0A8K0W296_9PLEO|nr:fungal-specific transcription factor domain-containing protein [Paraphoma chrysanthemicola]